MLEWGRRIKKRPRPDHDHDERPHGCYSGLVYIGHLEMTEEGEETEVIEAVPCQRCNA